MRFHSSTERFLWIPAFNIGERATPSKVTLKRSGTNWRKPPNKRLKTSFTTFVPDPMAMWSNVVGLNIP
jgi:hypothetical protein